MYKTPYSNALPYRSHFTFSSFLKNMCYYSVKLWLIDDSAEVSLRAKENTNTETLPKGTPKAANKKVGQVASTEGTASTSGLASQTASGVLSGSGVLNARPGSATSSGLLSHMVSPWNADIAREYLEKVADLLLEFAAADTTVKSYMCSQSLLSRLFQMFNRIEPPILLKVWRILISELGVSLFFFPLSAF